MKLRAVIERIMYQNGENGYSILKARVKGMTTSSLWSAACSMPFPFTNKQYKQKMKIKNIDHFVITTADLQACLDFYVGTLGMEHRESNGHHNLFFPGGKISIHTKKGEFQPAALNPTYGSQAFCLIVEDDLETVEQELMAKGIKLLTDIVERHGAHGTMRSLYVRDPDGNLVELSNYF